MGDSCSYKGVGSFCPEVRVSFCAFPHQLCRHHLQIQQMAGSNMWFWIIFSKTHLPEMHRELGTPWSVLLHCLCLHAGVTSFPQFICPGSFGWIHPISQFIHVPVGWGSATSVSFPWLCSLSLFMASWECHVPSWRMTVIFKWWWGVTFYCSVCKTLGSCAYFLLEFLPWCPVFLNRNHI